VALATGCDDESDALAGSPHESGGGASTTGASGGAGGDAGTGKSGAGAGGTGGDSGPCDCGDDPSFVHVPLECAEQHGLITTFQHDLAMYTDEDWQFGSPYYLLHGTCDEGYRTLEFSEAQENAGISTYDPTGNLVYRAYGQYSGPDPVCTRAPDSNFGNFGIGSVDPAESCTYCLVDSYWDDSLGGAPAEYDTTPCTPSDLE
jgi:hypothetical protein